MSDPLDYILNAQYPLEYMMTDDIEHNCSFGT